MSIYAISYIIQDKNMDIVIADDIKKLPELVQMKDEVFWKLCLVSDIGSMEKNKKIISIRAGEIIYNNDFLYEMLKLAGLEVNDFLKGKLESIFKDLKMSMEEFLPTIFGEEYGEKYKEEVKNIIDIFRGKHIWAEKIEKRLWSKCLENEILDF